MMKAKEISKQLAMKSEEVSRYLFPSGKRQGDEWCVGNIQGDIGKSLKIHLKGDKSGIWCDFSTGDAGDLLDLWALNKNLRLYEAMVEASHYLGIGYVNLNRQNEEKFNRPIIKKIKKENEGDDGLDNHNLCYLITDRKISIGTLKRFDIHFENDEIIFPYYRNNELIFIKYLKIERLDGKKQIRCESNCEPCLFGWQTIGKLDRSVTICEGEIDAMTLWQYGFPALSVPFGAGKGNKQKWIEYEYDRLSQFDEIFICMDNDKPGHESALDIAERLGVHRCRIVKLPLKDANECLKNGISKEVIQNFFRDSNTLDPEELKSSHTFTNKVIDKFYPPEGESLGYDPTWDKAKDKIKFRPSEISVWTGINGHGKSQFLGQLILGFIEQNAKVCIASLEIKPERLLMRLARQAGATDMPSPEYIKAIHDWYGDKLWLFDLVGTAKSKRLLEVFIYARQRYGIDIFVIDSFMKLDIAEDDYKAQKAFMEQLCDFKNQYNCHVHIVVHPRKGANELTPPGKLDNKGTGALSDLADNCFTIWRNKEKESLKQKQSIGMSLSIDEEAKLGSADCLWCCDKQREGEWEGKFYFWFDKKSLQYLPIPDIRPRSYVNYSRFNLL